MKTTRSGRRQIADNVARALGKTGAVVKIEGGKILAFKRPGTGYDAAAAGALKGLKPSRRRPVHHIVGDDIANQMRAATAEVITDFNIPESEILRALEVVRALDPATERSLHAGDYRRAVAVMEIAEAEQAKDAERGILIAWLEQKMAEFLAAAMAGS